MNRGEQTAERLQREALRLFEERGFDHVTVDEIAQAAGVSHMTFFRHFPTKESVVLDDPYDPIVGDMVAAVDPALPVLERVTIGLRNSWALIDEPEDEMTRRRISLAAGSKALRARVWENNHRTEDVIVEALERTGRASALESRIAAGAALGGITAALLEWAASPEGDSLGDVVGHALSLVAPGQRANQDEPR